MARSILIVNATQVVTSQANPQGLLSTVSGYPKTFDSNSYNGDTELTTKKAKADYFNRLGIMYDDTNANRIIKTVTLENVYGATILREFVGDFPVSEPEEEEPEQTEE